MLRQRQNGNGRITGARRLMDGGSIPPSSTIYMTARYRRRSLVLANHSVPYSSRSNCSVEALACRISPPSPH